MKNIALQVLLAENSLANMERGSVRKELAYAREMRILRDLKLKLAEAVMEDMGVRGISFNEAMKKLMPTN